MPSKRKFADIDGYIASAPAEVREVLGEIRRVVKSAVPSATEAISYGMPAFKLDTVFLYFAAFKNHVGVYPPVRARGKLDAELVCYRGEKGNLQFPLAEAPFPFDLIGKVASALARQHQDRSK
jgi:uncharacterized protein YdhG (YjbR/CyaY superfamily)